ncbi:hypothetical protein HZH66_015474 [Vespula vulgaris]|uniref:Fatty acyl-CoA reductase n=2 Tax=Vespula vulgaris TaxID=7454 RepID=A0A834J105_VESVU|nr:hypothetical protein HZH66_015474 [Vespula vulgaris]
MKKIFKSIFTFTDPFGKANTMEVLLKEGGQEMDVAKSSFRDIMKTRSADIESCIEYVHKSTPIQNFYDGQAVFITGATGFIGKLLIEKLLRECPGITCIYLLIRTKKGKSVLQRTNELIEDSFFDTLREKQPTFQNRIVTIEGDSSLPNLGISMIDRATLIREVSIVFNVAATVKFNEKIKLATTINVQSLKDLINLSKEMPKLKSFIHVSTAYANLFHNPIEEKFYEPPIDDDKLINLINSMSESFLDDITPLLLGIWPNTYVYTKSVAENLVKKHVDSIPIGIFRPGIVMPTFREPIQGWVNNTNGLIGITTNALMGLMRTQHGDSSIKLDIVFGDLTANGIIASAWDIASNPRSKEDFPIYNYVSKDNPITFGKFLEMTLKYGELIPSEKALWCHSFKIIKYRPVHLFHVYFLHLLPALIIDTIAVCVGKQPWLLQTYKKIHKMSDLLTYFCIVQCNFTNKRWNELMRKLTSEDRKLFFCDMKDIVWSNYFPIYILGVRKYILQDPIETLSQSRIKWRRFYWMDRALKLIIACVLIIVWVMTFRLFVTFRSS